MQGPKKHHNSSRSYFHHFLYSIHGPIVMSLYLTAYDHFNQHRNTLRLTTGTASLDSLIDSIQEGQFYLFYGSNKAVLDGLVHGLLVNDVLPIRQHGFEAS